MNSKSQPSSVSIWIEAARPRTLMAAIAPVVVGSAVAAREGAFKGVPSLLCLGFALLIQIGTNLANDYYDFFKGADTVERVGPRRAVASGLIKPKSMRTAMIAVFAAAFAVGVLLLPYGGLPLLAVGLSSIVCGVIYTGGPLPLAYLGLGDVFVFLFFGLVAVTTTAYVQTGRISRESILAGAAIGALSTNILLVNNYRDVENDAKANKRTVVVRFGRGYARLQFLTCLVVAFAVPMALFARRQSPWLLLPLVLIPMAALHFGRLRKAISAPELISLLGATAKLVALYSLLLSAGLLLG